MTEKNTDAEMHLKEKQESARNEVQQFINQHASANATEDLMRSIIVESVEFQGQDRTIIRDGNTNAILSKEQMLEKFRQERPSYLYSDQERINHEANQVDDTVYDAEKYIHDIGQKIGTGEITELSPEQKKVLLRIHSSVKMNDTIAGKKPFDWFRIFRKVGGLI